MFRFLYFFLVLMSIFTFVYVSLLFYNYSLSISLFTSAQRRIQLRIKLWTFIDLSSTLHCCNSHMIIDLFKPPSITFYYIVFPSLAIHDSTYPKSKPPHPWLTKKEKFFNDSRLGRGEAFFSKKESIHTKGNLFW